MKALKWTGPEDLPAGINYTLIEMAECGNPTAKKKILAALKKAKYTDSATAKFLKSNGIN